MSARDIIEADSPRRFSPPGHAVCGPAGVCAVAAFAFGGDCAGQGPQPRRRIGGGSRAGSGRTRHTGSRRLLPKGGRRGVLAARQPPGVRVQFASAQRQFTAADFALGALNHPAATDNFRAAFSVEQPLFDRTTSANVRAASIGRDMAATGKRLVDHDLTAAVTDAFGRVLIAAATARSAAAAVETARADRELAGNRRDAGRVTDADVLQAGRLPGAHARTAGAGDVGRTHRARPAESVDGRALETMFTMFSLDLTPPAIAIDITNPAGLEEEAVKNRPEVALAMQQEQLAAAAVDAARAAFLPQVAAQGGWELNGGAWNSRSSSWVAGAVARINLFHGFADKARLAEAREQATRRALERTKPRPWRGSMCRSRSPGSRPRGRAKWLDGRPPIGHERAAALSGTAMRAASRMRPRCCARPTPCSRPRPNKSRRV